MGKLSQPTPAGAAVTSQDPAQYEQENVHQVYEQIASHFSQTRYKPWPLVTSFLSTLSPGSIGADLGCGNGKYLHLRSILAPPKQNQQQHQDSGHDRAILTLGLDRSSNLIDIAYHNLPEVNSEQRGKAQRNEVCVGDALQSGYRSRSLDFSMSIATIHHFATEQRRIEAVIELIRIIKPVPRELIDAHPPATGEGPTLPSTGSGPGRFMIYVWALEQRGESRRNFESVGASAATTTTREEKQELPADVEPEASQPPREQDLLVPWVSSSSSAGPAGASGGRSRGKRKASATPVAGDDRVEAGEDAKAEATVPPPSTVFQRFYHVFREGQLEDLVQRAAEQIELKQRTSLLPTSERIQLSRQGSGWERGNWWTVWRVEEQQQQ